jgi:hypothetical protein
MFTNFALLRKFILLMLPVLFIFGCDNEDDDNNDQPQLQSSYVRVAHLSPDAPAVDVWVDGNLTLEDVTYQGVSAFLELTEGSHEITVVAANTNTPAVIQETVTLAANASYTVAASGLLNGTPALDAWILTDDRSPAMSQSKVRFAHASPDAPNVDVWAVGGTSPLFANVSFRSAGSYLSVAPASIALEVRVAGTENVVVRFAPINLEAGRNYTIFAKGLANPGSNPNALSAYAVVDAPGNGNLTVNLVPVDVAYSRLRVGHLSPDAPEVDVYVDNQLTLEDVPFLGFSNYLTVESGTHNIKVTPANNSAAVIDANVTLDADVNYSVAAMGLLGNNTLAPYVFNDDLVEGGQSKVRFIHGSPNAPAVDVRLRDGGVLFGNTAFGAAAPAIEVAGGTYSFDVNVAGTDQPALFIDNVPLSNGTNYTVFATGLLGDAANPLSAIAVVDDIENGSQVLALTSSAPAYAQVRIAHLAPDAPPVDVWVGGTIALQDVPFRAFSQYLEVLASRSTEVEVFVAGTNTNPVISATLTFDADEVYTIAATGLVGNGTLGPIVINDDLSTSGGSKIRFIHTSPDAPQVDITLTDGTVLFGNVEFNEALSFIEVSAGSYGLQVRVAGTETVALSFDGVALSGGTNYSIFATGLLSDGTLTATVAVDAPGNGSTSLNLTPATSKLRVAHLSPDAPNVDVYVDGESVLSNVPFTAVSGYLSVPSKTQEIEVFVSGTTMNPVISATLTWLPGEAYTVGATGLVGQNDLQPIVLMDNQIGNPNGDAHVRFVHTAPDAPAVNIRVANGGPTLFENVPFRGIADYIGVGAATYDLEVTIASNGQVVLTVPAVVLAGTTNYTIFAIGQAGNGTLAALPVVDSQTD